VIEMAKAALPEDDYANAVSLIEHGEHELALDLICQQLYEVEADVSPGLYEEITRAGNAIGASPSSWEFLAELVQ
jgi:hypothetical protein